MSLAKHPLLVPSVYGMNNNKKSGVCGAFGPIPGITIHPALPDHPNSKVNLAVNEIERIWRESAPDLCHEE
jgi:hypothetical protein